MTLTTARLPPPWGKPGTHSLDGAVVWRAGRVQLPFCSIATTMPRTRPALRRQAKASCGLLFGRRFDTNTPASPISIKA